jgi:condensin complex subunit 3
LQIFLGVLEHMMALHKELDEDDDMVAPAQVAGMFVEWTDPQKVV